MLTTIAITIDRKFALITNGNHMYWTQATASTMPLSRTRQPAGRTLDNAVRSLIVRASTGH